MSVAPADYGLSAAKARRVNRYLVRYLVTVTVSLRHVDQFPAASLARTPTVHRPGLSVRIVARDVSDSRARTKDGSPCAA